MILGSKMNRTRRRIHREESVTDAGILPGMQLESNHKKTTDKSKWGWFYQHQVSQRDCIFFEMPTL